MSAHSFLPIHVDHLPCCVAQLKGSGTLQLLCSSALDLRECAEAIIADSIAEGYFVSPKHVSWSGVNSNSPMAAGRRLMQIYSLVANEQLATAFASAFLADPSAAVCVPSSCHALLSHATLA
jgi:hypothetical protein